MTRQQLSCIHHVGIPVKNIKRVVERYTKRFQCEIVYQDEIWAMIGFENINLAIVVQEQHPPHVAFEPENAEEYGPLKDHRDRSRSTYIEDSENNTVEIMAAD